MLPPAVPGPDGASVSDSGAWVDGGRWVSRYRRFGPLRYSDLGRRRLSPPGDVGPLAAWLAASADGWWAARGAPDPFTLVVVSGDDGRLAAAVLARSPTCAPALRYVLVQPDHPHPAFPPAAMTAAVPLENPAFLYPAAPSAAGRADLDEDLEPTSARGIGPLFTFLGDLPGLGDGGAASAVVAVEFLSRLPYDVFVLDDRGRWSEVRLAEAEAEAEADAGTDPGVEGGALVEIDVPLEAPPAGVEASRGPGRLTRWTGAVEWLRQVLAAGGTTTLAVLERELPPGLLASIGRPADPPELIESTHLRSVEWRLG